MRQAQFAYTMHNDRRQWEWKLTLGLWAVILATVVKGIDVPMAAWGVVVLLYGGLWLRPVWVANKNNKVWYDHFMKEAACIQTDPDHAIPPPPGVVTGRARYTGFLTDWGMQFQLITTAILAAFTAWAG